MTARAILVTGTDTGVGKTLVACAIAAALVREGVAVGVCKPVETGRTAGGRDAERLIAAAGGTQSLDDVCPYRFDRPVTPLLAAESAGASIDMAWLAEYLCALATRFDVLLVEGAGGLLSPMARGATMADLARDAGLAALVVVANRLGCLNHALLTETALRQSNLPMLGFVFTSAGAAADDASLDSNARILADVAAAPVLCAIPRLPESAQGDDAALADALLAADEGRRLLTRIRG
ncbi:dethiobiotin synthase [bacterium]|nr:dethiobiotin synthase [bacterium]